MLYIFQLIWLPVLIVLPTTLSHSSSPSDVRMTLTVLGSFTFKIKMGEMGKIGILLLFLPALPLPLLLLITVFIIIIIIKTFSLFPLRLF